MKKVDKKTTSLALLVLSLVGILLAALDYIGNVPVLNLGADSWLLVSIVVAVYAVYAKSA
ncbi:MAG: hypothetical protein A2172_04155 [Candidatus Woykebacteria bacterium RBG_13_40_15]|uniref:DUF5668 domain-containing protein n=1 Tax=Candidatus Woykebacteria bacterium RBG_13_40_15 TaxID=1802593 RepID=A0A1G1W6U7_9BACT|nr:MAG: hypothetical protein A2172_04155 [Candidatus Woykebacteria bacterium RBG_13_40_15]